MHYQLAIQDKKYVVKIGAVEDGIVAVSVNDEAYHVSIENLDRLNPEQAGVQRATVTEAVDAAPVTPAPATVRRGAAAPVAPAAATVGDGVVTAPIPGLLLDLKVQVGDTVAIGQTLAIIEAMKMENNISSPIAGKVRDIRVESGATVADGDVIMVIG